MEWELDPDANLLALPDGSKTVFHIALAVLALDDGQAGDSAPASFGAIGQSGFLLPCSPEGVRSVGEGTSVRT
jgi:hypothetical protein